MTTLYKRIIRHETNKDLCYLITRCFDAGHKYVLKASILNMGFSTTFPINEECRFFIKKDNLKDWLVCKEPLAKCIRYVTWEKLA